MPLRGEAVTGKESREQPPKVQGLQRLQQAKQADRGTDEVQAPASAVTVFGQIEERVRLCVVSIGRAPVPGIRLTGFDNRHVFRPMFVLLTRWIRRDRIF